MGSVKLIAHSKTIQVEQAQNCQAPQAAARPQWRLLLLRLLSCAAAVLLPVEAQPCQE